MHKACTEDGYLADVYALLTVPLYISPFYCVSFIKERKNCAKTRQYIKNAVLLRCHSHSKSEGLPLIFYIKSSLT
jgi:hypothetical protein